MTNAIKFTLSLNDAGFATSAKRAEKSLADVGKAGQVSAGQIRQATQQLPAQFTDIATSLASGQNPFLVLLQQGGQIKDQFGGIGNAIKGIGSAISPVGLVIGGVVASLGTMALAAFQGATESQRLRDTLLLTGNAAGLTSSRMDKLAESVAASTLQTVAGSREILTSLAATGQTSAAVLEGQAKVIGRIADLSGKAGKDIAASFAGQLEGPVKFAAKLNEAYNFLSVAQFKRIQQLAAEGKATAAVALTNDTLLAALDKQRQNLGTLESAWHQVGRAASGAWDFMLGLGRAESTVAKIEGLRSQIGSILKSSGGKEPAAGTLSAGRINAMRQQIQLLAEQAKQEGAAAAKASEDAASNRSKINEAANAKPGEPLSAIRDARQQYLTDFLRSEKAVYAELEEQDKKLRDLARQDPLGEFITERVLPESNSRAQQRLTSEAAILQSLVDENARAGAELLTSERDRGRAVIELDRDIGIRRLQQQNLSNEALVQGIVEVNTRADIALKALNQQIVQKELDSVDAASQSMADSISTGILEGFRRGNSLADIFLQELKAQFAKTVLSPLIKPVVEAGNSGLQSLLQSIALDLSGEGITVSGAGGAMVPANPADYATGAAIRGRRAAGGPVRPFSTYLVGEQGPELLRMGAQGGSVVPNSAMGGVNLAPSIGIRIDARTDQAQVSQLVAAGVQQGMQTVMEQLRIMGVTR